MFSAIARPWGEKAEVYLATKLACVSKHEPVAKRSSASGVTEHEPVAKQPDVSGQSYVSMAHET